VSLFLFLFNVQGEFNDAIGATKCQLCSKNSFATDKNRQSPCNQCAPGRNSKNGSTKCSDCAPGTFKNDLNGEEVCTECPIGFAQSKPDETNCNQCLNGTEAPTLGNSVCVACDLGKFNSVAGHNCTACPAGHYQDGKGETSCKECGVDTHLNEPGSTSIAECTLCSDDRSTGTTKGNTNVTSCLCKRGDNDLCTEKDRTSCGYYQKYYHNDKSECIACPTGADCSLHDGMRLPELFALPGYYRSTTHKFVPCSHGYSPPEPVDKHKERCCPFINEDSTLSVCNNASNSSTHCYKG
jgi:hypothetical protein